MKQGLTINDLAAEVKRQNDAKLDVVADTRRISLSTDSTAVGAGFELLIDGAAEDGGLGVYGVKDTAHEQIAGRLKIPREFYDRLRYGYTPRRGNGTWPAMPELLAHNVNTLLHAKPEKRMVRTLDGAARAFLSDRYRALDNYDLLESVLPILAKLPDVRFESTHITESKMYVKAVLPRIQTEVKKGDVVQAGVVISNSEIGRGSLAVYPMVFRLICLNGMIAEDKGMRKYHVGGRLDEGDETRRVFSDQTLRADDTAFFLKVRDLVTAAVDEAQFLDTVQGLKELAEFFPLHAGKAGPVEAVQRIVKKHDLTETEGALMLEHLIEGGDLSAYGFVNAVTRTSQDVEDYDRASDLEALGGALAVSPKREWEALAVA